MHRGTGGYRRCMPHGDMTDAEPTIIRGEVCRFDFSGPNTCPISKVLESEIRLNGILVGLSAG